MTPPLDLTAGPDGTMPLNRAIHTALADLATYGPALTELLEEIKRQNAILQRGAPLLGLTQATLPQTDRPDQSAGPLSLDSDGYLRTRQRSVVTHEVSVTIPAGQVNSGVVRLSPRPNVEPTQPKIGCDLSDTSRFILILDDVTRAGGEVVTARASFDPAGAVSWGLNVSFAATVGIILAPTSASGLFPYHFLRSSIAVAADRTFRYFTCAV